jgi:hypothetical protein
MTADNLAEASIVDPTAEIAFGPDDRLLKREDHIREILGALVVDECYPNRTHVRLAHQSVKEYLLSNECDFFRITKKEMAKFLADCSIARHSAT